ncbi:MAG: tRNA 2-selenouridine(34) synthase MnmH [Ferruginibacter sp.]
MAINIISIEHFQQGVRQVIIDVRSPAEYSHAHIPGAYSLPLFNDQERKVIGTAYKQQSREKAIKYGLEFFGPRMKEMVEKVENIFKKETGIKNQQAEVYIHCWRGGMRSHAVGWLLNLYGFKVFLLEGGYKSYRKWVLQQFESDYDFKIIGGYTGSGKTPVVYQLLCNNQPVIDFEGLANHKGSAFGAINQPSQPSQEMFENLLATELFKKNMGDESPIWLEDESQRIGMLNIPMSLWKTIRKKPVYFIDIPFEQRLKYIIQEYGSNKKEELVNAIIRIHKRLGPVETKTAIGFLLENKISECFSILLNYYDKHYSKALVNRENINTLLTKIYCTAVDSLTNTEKILRCDTVNV